MPHGSRAYIRDGGWFIHFGQLTQHIDQFKIALSGNPFRRNRTDDAHRKFIGAGSGCNHRLRSVPGLFRIPALNGIGDSRMGVDHITGLFKQSLNTGKIFFLGRKTTPEIRQLRAHLIRDNVLTGV